MTLVNNCEIAVAAEDATFGMPEITFGQFPALAGPTTLRRILPKHAIWMIMTGQRIDAQTAVQWGLINEVVTRDRLLPRAVEIAEQVAKFDAVGLDYCKKAYRVTSEMGWSAGIDYGLTLPSILQTLKDVQR